jgi:NosR/NirI family transcriptional regulator, nitrous oxide reductase regulator
MRILANTVLVLLAVSVLLSAQTSRDAKVDALLKRLFPAATSISAKEGAPPHFNVFGKPAGAESETLIGLGFWTTELEPLERGYDGPIKILVGMDIRGVLAGVVVVDHHEPYGNFSVDPPAFAAQFVGKSVRDPFKVGQDIDAVSRASISILSATRAIRNSSRRMATRYLTPPQQ